MPAGIEIINSSGTVLIDDTFKNLCLRQKGTGTPSPSITDPIVAVNASNWFAFGDPPMVLSPGGARLMVYDANGKVTFDSSRQYLRMVDVISGTAVPNTPQTYTYPAGRTYAIAIMRKGFEQRIVTWQEPLGWYYRYDVASIDPSVSGNQIIVDAKVDQGITGGPNPNPGAPHPAWKVGAWTIAVVDVTGY